MCVVDRALRGFSTTRTIHRHPSRKPAPAEAAAAAAALSQISAKPPTPATTTNGRRRQTAQRTTSPITSSTSSLSPAPLARAPHAPRVPPAPASASAPAPATSSRTPGPDQHAVNAKQYRRGIDDATRRPQPPGDHQQHRQRQQQQQQRHVVGVVRVPQHTSTVILVLSVATTTISTISTNPDLRHHRCTSTGNRNTCCDRTATSIATIEARPALTAIAPKRPLHVSLSPSPASALPSSSRPASRRLQPTERGSNPAHQLYLHYLHRYSHHYPRHVIGFNVVVGFVVPLLVVLVVVHVVVAGAAPQIEHCLPLPTASPPRHAAPISSAMVALLTHVRLPLQLLMLLLQLMLMTGTHRVAGGGSQSTGTGPGSSSSNQPTIKYSRNTVKTKYGPLRGIIARSSPPVEAFLGVPYATPPVGSLRFMPPVTPSTWRNVRLADRFSPVCPQRSPLPDADGPDAERLYDIPRSRLLQLRRLRPLLTNQSEDCLYLNLYVPRSETANKARLATVVYIHGESYEWNAGNTYDGSVLAGHGNVIVVTINFRLGVLGFLKTGPKGSPQGNFGLMDLVAGLHWLHENLAAFNGDQARITVMGHTTGAALANILIVSPVASDLIHRAVLLSGSAASPWAIQRDPVHVKRRVAEHTGCRGDMLALDIAPCLRSKSVEELLTVQVDSPRFLAGFAPFVDGTVIMNADNRIPLQLPAGSAIATTLDIELADFPTKELLFALTSTESYLDLNAQDLQFGFNESRRDRIFRTYVRNVYRFHLNEIFSTLKNEYTDWERPPRNPMGPRDATLEFLSDGHTAAPLIRLAYLHSLRGGRSYFMHFQHEGDRDFPQRLGSVRGEDVPYFLGLPIANFVSHNYTRKEVQLSRTIVQFVANFARQGNPNEATSASAHVDSYAYDYIEGPAEMGRSHQHQMKVVAAVDKRKRQAVHRTQKRSGSSHSIGTDDSDEFDGGNEYDSVESASDAKATAPVMPTLSTTVVRKPFWDTYDSINQLYLEIGTKLEIKNHYRGHKLSMWLSLIPQLHNPGDLADLTMRHHHFTEEAAQFYDGIVRAQMMQPSEYKNAPAPNLFRPAATAKTTEQTSNADIPRTECAPNTTIVSTIAATHHIQSTQPHQTYSIAATNTNLANATPANNNNKVLRQLADGQKTTGTGAPGGIGGLALFAGVSTTTMLTLGIGVVLVLLNLALFIGIYLQHMRHLADSSKKEELTATTMSSTDADSIGGPGGSGGGGGGGGGGGAHIDRYKSSLSLCPSIHDEKCAALGVDSKHSLHSISDLNLSEYNTFYDDGSKHCLKKHQHHQQQQHHHHHHQLYYHQSHDTPKHQHQHQQQQQLQCSSMMHHPVHAQHADSCQHQHNQPHQPGGGSAEKTGHHHHHHRHSISVADYNQLSSNGHNGFATTIASTAPAAAAVTALPAVAASTSTMDISTSTGPPATAKFSSYLGASCSRLNHIVMLPTSAPPVQCNQSTQSDIPDVHDVGTGAMDNDVDVQMANTERCRPLQAHPLQRTAQQIARSTDNLATLVRQSSAEPPSTVSTMTMTNTPATTTAPPAPSSGHATLPRSQGIQGGILRHQNSAGSAAAATATPSANKKRVHIQEISV